MLRSDGHFVLSIWKPKSFCENFLSIIPEDIRINLQERYREMQPIDDVLNKTGFKCIKKIDTIFGDDRTYSHLLENLPKDGYQSEIICHFENAIRQIFPNSKGRLGIYLCKKI